MNSQSHQRKVRRLRRWRVALGISAGAAAAAMIGLSEAADAHADDGTDVLGQAGMDLTQATQVLDAAPETSLDAQQLALLTGQEALQTGSASTFLASQESLQAGLPVAEQADLTNADDQLVQAFQGILNADQAFAAADQAGDLTGGTGLMAELGVIDADLAVIPADFHLLAADVGADLASLFDVSSLLP
jgi:hypothetical protein